MRLFVYQSYKKYLGFDSSWMPFLFRMCANRNIFKRFHDTLRIFFISATSPDLTLGRRSGPPLKTQRGAPSWPPITWQRQRLCVTVWPSWCLGGWGEYRSGRPLAPDCLLWEKNTAHCGKLENLCQSLPQTPRYWIAIARDSSLALLYFSLLLSISRCIGSIQHLKSKFGKDYLLEMKVKTLTQVESLNTEIMTLFPQAARQER